MLSLIAKDLRVSAVFLWLVVPVYVVLALGASRAGGAMFWVNVAFGTMLVLGLSTLDVDPGAETFVHSLPVTRAMVVRARYGTAMLAVAAALVIGALLGLAAALRSIQTGGAWPRWVAGDIGLAYVLVMALIIALYLPCYYRWGIRTGTVVSAVALVAAILVSDLAGGWLASALHVGPAQDGLPRGLVVQCVAAMAHAVGLAGATVATAAVVGLLLWISAGLAVRAYRVREF